MEITTKQYEELISRAAVQAAFKPRSEWTIEEYRVWLRISEDLLKQEREKSEAYKSKLQSLEAFVEQITAESCFP